MNKKFLCLMIGAIVVILLALVKSLDLKPADDSIWNDEPVQQNQLVDKYDFASTKFEVANIEFKLVDINLSDNLGEMPIPLLSRGNDEIIIDDEGNIISDHIFLEVTYNVTNIEKETISHCAGNIILILLEDGIGVHLHEFSSNNFNSVPTDKQYMMIEIQPNEVKENLKLGLIMPKEELETYELMLRVNPFGRSEELDGDGKLINSDIIKYIDLEPMLKDEV